MDESAQLEMQISDIILEVANFYTTATTSDLQGIADAAAKRIITLTQSATSGLNGSV